MRVRFDIIVGARDGGGCPEYVDVCVLSPRVCADANAFDFRESLDAHADGAHPRDGDCARVRSQNGCVYENVFHQTRERYQQSSPEAQ